MAMLLQTSRILLRSLEAEDLDRLYRWENDVTAWDSSSNIAPFSRKQLWDYIETYDGDIFRAGQLRLVVVDRMSESAAGMIDLFDIDAVNRRASIGIYIDPEWRGKGYGLEAVNVVGRYAFDRLGFHQLAAIVAVDNCGSVAMFREAGFKICGRLRSWLRRGQTYADVFMFQKMLSPST